MDVFNVHFQTIELLPKEAMTCPYSLWPAFKRGDSVECEHGIQYIIKVKVIVDPLPLMELYVVQSVLHMMHIISPDINKENPY